MLIFATLSKKQFASGGFCGRILADCWAYWSFCHAKKEYAEGPFIAVRPLCVERGLTDMDYASKDIRNVMVAGHSGCGKTTLVEALLNMSGATERVGRVEDGTTASDFDPEEIRRHVSLNASVVPVEMEGVKFNFIDVPGLFDFETGIAEGTMAAESVLILVSGRSGVSVGAEKAYKQAVRNHKARMIFVNKMDLENADYFKILDGLKAEFGSSICPAVVPTRLADGSMAYLNLFSRKAFTYKNGKQVQVDLPNMGERLEELIAAMDEAIAETDEELMMKFFDGEPFTVEEIVRGMAAGVRTGQITPVFCGSATGGQALDMLLRNMKELLPGADTAHVQGETADGASVELTPDPTAPVCAYVFKTVADPFVGKLSYLKVISGKLTGGATLTNARTGAAERIGKTLTVCGKKQSDTPAIVAGDIGAVAKLTTARTGDTLCDASRVVSLPMPTYPIPTYRMAIKVAKKGDEGKVSGAIARLIEEDPSIQYVMDSETRQQVISGLGAQHLEVAVAKLKNKFGVEVTLEDPRVPYRESIRKTFKAQGRHKKQTGGHGQFGDVWIEFSPIEGDAIEFEEKIFGGSVPKNFFPAVEKGVRQAAEKGVLAGYPMVGMKATLLDGSYHPVDSSEMAFIMAAKLAYKAAVPKAGPVLLEPIGTLKAHVPSDNTGDIMSEVTKRRGRVLGMNPDEDNQQIVEAEVPMAEMQDFTTFLRQLTQGRGWFTFEFVRYETLPQMLESKVIEQAKELGNLAGEEE